MQKMLQYYKTSKLSFLVKVTRAFKGKKPYPIHIPFIPISHPVKKEKKKKLLFSLLILAKQ